MQSLFDLFEKGFDAPARFIQVGDAVGRPCKIVGHEGHRDSLAVDFDPGDHAAN